jgi:hypothetical protein
MVKVASIKNIIKDLTPRQQKTMRSHARHHSLKHMRSMARLMSGAGGRRKRTFAQFPSTTLREMINKFSMKKRRRRSGKKKKKKKSTKR